MIGAFNFDGLKYVLTIINVNVNERVGEMLRFVKIPIQIAFSPYLILSEALLLLAESIYI